MDKDEDSYPSATNTAASMTTFANLDHFHREYHHHQQQHQQVVQEQQQQPADPAASSSSSLIVGHHEGFFGHGVHHHDRADRVGHDDGDNNNNSHETANMAAAGDYMLSHSSATALKPPPFDRLSFADVMQFADFGPKLALNHHHYRHQQLLPAINKAINHADEVEQLQEEIDPINHNPRNERGHYDNNNLDPHVYFLKFPVLGDRPQDSRHEQQQEEVELQQLIHGELGGASYHDQLGAGGGHGSNIFMSAAAAKDVSNNNNNPAAAANAALVDFQLLGENNRNIRDFDDHKSPSAAAAAINTITTTTAAHDIADPMIAIIKNMSTSSNNNNNVKRKRPRSVKTSEEVESQRMTHIAVERNRRKQMNEHLRVLRSLMPTSYVQRGDQASIIGGAIEFVRELEQLLQCLESQKRRRLFGTADHQPTAAAGTTAGVGVIIGQQLPPRPLGDVGEDPSSSLQGIQKQHEQQQQQQHPPIFLQFPPMLPPPPYGASGTAELNNSQQQQQQGHQAAKLVDLDIMSTTGSCMREETAESKSCIADVEVKMLGFDALIKILSRRRPGQLIKVIAALEDLQFNILHTNITTIEQTVLYSFNVKVASESVFTAEEIASSVQHIFTFIHANSNTN